MNEANGSEPSNRPTISEASCSCAMNRRGFLGASLGCGAYVAMALAAAPVMTRRAFAQQPKGEAQLTMPFARVEKIADGVWAVVSVTSGGDYTTVSNGGIVAGRDGVLCIEGFNTPAGGRWINQLAKELTPAVGGDDERYQGEVMRLAPAPKFSPRQAAAKGD